MKILRLTCAFFGFLVGVGIAIAQSNPPAPTPPKGANDNQRLSQREESQKKAEEKTPQDGSALHLKLNAVVTGGEQEQHRDSQKNDASSDRWPFWTNLVIAAATVASATIAFFQWRTYRRQADLMERGLVVTQQAADAATESAKTNSRITELTERAELQIVGFSLPPFNRFVREAKFEMRYKNFGKTIATNVIANVRFHEIPNATLASTPSVIAAGGENFFATFIDEIHGRIPDERLNAFENGTEQLRLVVELSFTDIFDQRTRLVYDVRWDSRDRVFKFSVTGRETQKAA